MRDGVSFRCMDIAAKRSMRILVTFATVALSWSSPLYAGAECAHLLSPSHEVSASFAWPPRASLVPEPGSIEDRNPGTLAAIRHLRTAFSAHRGKIRPETFRE